MDYRQLNKIHEELEKVKVCLGSRYTSPFWTSINGLRPNKKGNIVEGEPTNMRDVIYHMMNGNFVNLAKKEQAKQPDKPLKYFARSIYPSDDNRYTIYENTVDDNGKQISITTNYAYHKWNGFQGFDIDSDKNFYTDEQCVEIGMTLKKICHEKLSKYDWFIGSTLSTGGKGTHVYTATRVNEYIDDEETIIKMYHLNFQVKSFAIFECLVELCNQLDYVSLDHTYIDTAMDTPTQTTNITVCDCEPLLNENFKFVYDDNVSDLFHMGCNKVIISTEAQLMLNDAQKIRLNEYEKWYDREYNDELKGFEKTSNNDNIVITGFECKGKDFDLSKSKGPFYFRHAKNADKFWTGNQVINTLLCFYDKETVKEIWRHPKFYDGDPSDWIRFVDSWNTNFCGVPNKKLVYWLNENCGFNIEYEINVHEKTPEEIYDHVIRLRDDEFLGDYEHELFSYIHTGINIIISGTGTGKTTIWKNRDKRQNDDLLNIANIRTTIITEPYNAVLDNKFPDDEYEVFKGSRHLSWNALSPGLCAANYKKIIELSNGDEEWDKIDYIVIDESHLLTKEYFRSDDLIKMIDFIKRAAQHVPVVLMTGTPIDELEIFDDINTIKVIKNDKRNIYYKNVRFKPNEKNQQFDVSMLLTLIKHMRSENRKVYIYDSNIALRKCKLLQELLCNENVCIYHKRHIDDKSNDDDMRYIDEHHMLGDKYDVIISSCYFGVGNDLNDTCDTACIIIGNHTWQEDIQIIGRWRNSMDIKVYNVYMPDDERNNKMLDKQKLLNYYIEYAERQYFDSRMRNKATSITSNIIKINNCNDVPIIARMLMCDMYNSSVEYKYKMLLEYQINIDENQVQPLYWNDNDIEIAKMIKRRYSDIDKQNKIQTLFDLQHDGTIDWQNGDKRVKDWQRHISYVFHNNKSLYDAMIEDDWLLRSKNNDTIALIVRLMKNKANGLIDYAEIKSFEFVRQINNGVFPNKVIEQCDNIGINVLDYYIACAYSYMIHHANFNEESVYYKIEGDYFWSFRRKCKKYINITDDIFDALDIEFDDTDIERVRNHTISIHNDMYVVNQRLQALKRMQKDKKREGGKKGGQLGKRVVVTDKMKQKLLDKYNLKIGDVFESCSDVVTKINVSKNTVTKWQKNGWLSSV